MLIAAPRPALRLRQTPGEPDSLRWQEVWDGEPVMPPMPGNEHQRIVIRLCSAISEHIDWDAGDCCLPGANVSDRETDWQFNYRIPDVLVVKAGGLARDLGTHWLGGPDLVAEIISPEEDPHAKLSFYESIGVREVFLYRPDPAMLEHYILNDGRLERDPKREMKSVVLDALWSIDRHGRLMLSDRHDKSI